VGLVSLTMIVGATALGGNINAAFNAASTALATATP
jgi:Flp pilus assembly pilin Flp